MAIGIEQIPVLLILLAAGRAPLASRNLARRDVGPHRVTPVQVPCGLAALSSDQVQRTKRMA